MSAYIVNKKTIHAIAKGFNNFNCKYNAEDYEEPVQIIIDFNEINNRIGQSLLNQNYKSVNYRYNENVEVPIYKYEDIEVDEGVILGCINEYEYQACETPDYFESDIHYSLIRLKEAMLTRLIKQKGCEIPWGLND